jgi:hypothetical protein
MRAYLSADAEMLRELRDGGSVAAPLRIAASDDEIDEFDALTATAAPGRAVVAVEVDQPDLPVDATMIAALHVDADGSGDLAWYAPEEINQVLELLRR